ncbi:MAG: LysR family transcriptional regulator [Pseudomonadota bacterium]
MSRAADILGISQPTLSSVLKQLREEFNDPLLVRVGNRMELTAKAKLLEEPLNSVFEAVDTLWDVETANPSESRRNVLVGSTDYGAFITAAPLYKKLAEEAPGIAIQYVDAAETVEMVNQESEIDFYLVPDLVRHSPAFQNFKFVHLFDEEMVYLVGNHHRLAQVENPSAEEINKEPFATYHVGAERYSFQSLKIISNLESDRNIVLRVQQFSVLPKIAQNANCVVILPRRMANALAEKHNCTILGAIEPSFKFSICLMWERVYQTDDVHEYLRDTFKELFGS